MKFETLLVERDGPLGRLTLHRPERHKAINAQMLKELAEAAYWFDQQPDLRVVIVAGKGRVFSAGADLKDAARGTVKKDTSVPIPCFDRREAAQLGTRMAAAIENMRATTIAQLQGHVIGGGVVLALACDLRIAAEGTVFLIPEVDLGVPLAWGGIPRLVREIGPALTKELVMTCRPFSPEEAKAMGFVNRVVALDDLEAQVQQLADELVSKPAVPLGITKAQVNYYARMMAMDAPYDGEMLMSMSTYPETAEAGIAYRERTIGKKKSSIVRPEN